jgi:predicted AAA+ superfamily ATPase
MNKEIIKRYLLDFQERKFENIRKREIRLEESSKIQTIIGARRTGKTFLLYNKILELEKAGVPRDRMIYINFENPVLNDISYKEIKEIIEVHWSMFPEATEKKMYLFVDEPQVIKNWEIAIRNLYDDYNFEIFITGSSSQLLSREIATSLRGRSIATVLLPLSFAEYLDFVFSGIKNPQKISTKQKAELLYHFEKYLQFGSYPEVVLEKSQEIKIRILKDYFDLTVYKDLVDRYKIRNVNLIKILIDLVVASVAKEFSINKHYQDLKSRNIALSKGTLYEYFSVLEDAFFVFSLKRFSHSRKTENLSISKVYLGDVGFLNLYSLKNFGQRLENIVFLHLFRQTVQNPLLKINYWQSDQNEEIDFVVQEGKKIKSLIQVSYKIDDLETKKREIKSMLKGMDALNVTEGLIVTLDTESEEKIDNKKIRIIPIWKLNSLSLRN